MSSARAEPRVGGQLQGEGEAGEFAANFPKPVLYSICIVHQFCLKMLTNKLTSMESVLA